MPIVSSDDLLKRLRTDAIDNIYMIYGKDVLLVESLKNKIIKKYLKNEAEVNINKIRGKDLDVSVLCDNIDSFPMFSDYNFISINDLNVEEIPTDILNFLIKSLSDVPETTIILIYITGFDLKNGKKTLPAKSKKIVDTISKNGIVCEADLKKPFEIVKFIVDKVGKNSCSINKKDAERIAELCLSNMLMINNEVDKLCSFVEKGEITSDLINKMVSKQLDSTAFNLAKAITQFKGIDAMNILDELIYQKEEIVAILSAVSSAFIDLYRVKVAYLSNKKDVDVIEDFAYRGREFVVRNAFRDVSKISIEHLRKCINILAKADLECKSKKIDGRILLEKAFAEMILFRI